MTTATTTTFKRTNDQELNLLLEKYFDYERVEEHKRFIGDLLLDDDKFEQVESLIKNRLTFGTAGIRGSMGAGFNQINDLVVIQTAQGLVSYLLELELLEADKERCLFDRGVIIGNDARHNSSRFARLIALAFLQKNIKVYFCDYIIPTPLIAFGVREFNCNAGVVVTASHNPKQDNGFKVYWSNGAQILSPHDKEIQRHIMKPENQKPWPQAWREDLLRSSSNKSTSSPSSSSSSSSNDAKSLPKEWSVLLQRIHLKLVGKYDEYTTSLSETRRQFNQAVPLSITYTTMHGVGHNYLSKALELAGFQDTFPVELQKKPDPEFSTVKFPNPEEAGALDLAFETARHANSELILANDPDADRCAAALYDPHSGYRRVLNGNEIGALLGWWIWYSFLNFEQVQENSNEDNVDVSVSVSDDTTTIHLPPLPAKKRVDCSDCYMISTAVSSKFLSSMAKVEGFQYLETLTGFKYIGNLADKLIREESKLVLFAYEEAIGYMVNSRILDKDGISAAIQLAQCASFVKETYQRTLEQQLDCLHSLYGYHFNLNSYFLCSDARKIREIFTNLQKNYPKDFGNQYKVTRIRDLNNGFDSSGGNNPNSKLPISSSSYMITFFVNDNITLTLRTSGTEPKIKYYSEINVKLPPLANLKVDLLNANEGRTGTQLLYERKQLLAKEAAQEKLRHLVEAAIEACLRPGHYQLEPAVAAATAEAD